MKRPVFAAAGVAGALGLVVSACGGPAANGVGSKSATAILAAARSAAEGAQAAHLVEVIDSGAQAGTVEFDQRSPSSAEGNFALANGWRYTILQLGKTAYLKANTAFLSANGFAAHSAKLSDQCIEYPIGPENESSLDMYSAAHSILTDSLKASDPLTKGATSTVDGQAVIAIHGHGSATLYVATTGTPYPVEEKTSSGTVTFSGWNEPLSLTAFSPCLTLAQANAGG
ncbi:MAG: hypothetical protein ACRDX8_05750 [Acidimicrobiales bacterium]